MTKRRVLILCTGNSCRSQMAEGFINHLLGTRWQAHSAGTDPAGTVHPLAVEAMDEIGIDISENESKHADAYRHLHFDAVITVCDDAAEKCPLWLGAGKVTHVGFPDPARASGSKEEKMRVFRQVRDGMREKLVKYLSQFDEG